ncbi:MAG TPA: GtrA family protein [Spirochaetales bacterium]|nr:GtrA family protein [Spirochaetales bacterium]HOV37078.1 GtrA family protein [Spirochaetales bacterium]
MAYRFLMFFLSRLTGTGIDIFILSLLSTFVFSSYAGKYLLAPAFSFVVATFHNYAVSYFWIWHKRIEKKSTSDFLRKLIPYHASVVFGFGIKMAFLLLLERLFHWDVIWCNLGALLVSGLVNFYLGEHVIFKGKIPKQEDPGFLETKERGNSRKEGSIHV